MEREESIEVDSGLPLLVPRRRHSDGGAQSRITLIPERRHDAQTVSRSALENRYQSFSLP
jgi:hypothetical protein